MKSTIISIAVNRELDGLEHLDLLNQASHLWSKTSLTEWASRATTGVGMVTPSFIKREGLANIDWATTFADSNA